MNARRCAGCRTHLGDVYVQTATGKYWCIYDADRGRQVAPAAWAGATVTMLDLQFRLVADPVAAPAIKRGA